MTKGRAMKGRAEPRHALRNCRQGDEAREAERRNEVTPFSDFFYEDNDCT